MVNYMDYTCGVTGIAKLRNEQVKTVIGQVEEAVNKAIQEGYKYFCLSFTGDASVHYAQGIHQAVQGNKETTIELLLPFIDPSIDHAQQSMIRERLNRIPTGTINGGFATVRISPTDNYVMVTHDRMLDNSSRIIVVSDGADPDVLSIISTGKNIDVPVDVIMVD